MRREALSPHHRLAQAPAWPLLAVTATSPALLWRLFKSPLLACALSHSKSLTPADDLSEM